MDDGGGEFGGKHARAGDDQLVSIDGRVHLVEIHAGKSDQHDDLAFRLQHVDRRLPGWHPRREPGRPEQLAVQPFGARQHLAGLRPHPVACEIAVHRPVVSRVLQIRMAAPRRFLSFVDPDERRLGENVLARFVFDIAAGRLLAQCERSAGKGKQAEMIMMRSAPPRRTGAIVAGPTEVIDRLFKPRAGGIAGRASAR